MERPAKTCVRTETVLLPLQGRRKEERNQESVASRNIHGSGLERWISIVDILHDVESDTTAGCKIQPTMFEKIRNKAHATHTTSSRLSRPKRHSLAANTRRLHLRHQLSGRGGNARASAADFSKISKNWAKIRSIEFHGKSRVVLRLPTKQRIGYRRAPSSCSASASQCRAGGAHTEDNPSAQSAGV